MRRARVLAWALAAVLALTACGGPSPGPSPSPAGEPTTVPSATPAPAPTATTAPSPTPTPEPTPPVYDPDHSLDTDLPRLRGGLELPIQGATGYAAVELELWAAVPASTPEPTPTVSPTPEPTPTAAPTPEPTPTAAPEPSLTPAPPPESSAPVTETAAAPTSAARAATGPLATLPPGAAFTVLEEQEGWWKVSSSYGAGWVEHRFCMVNLPDVIPSIVYDAVNSYSARYVSSGRAIPGVTGKALYQGKAYNPRFGEEQFLMPALYATAKKLCAAQRAALTQGNTLILYEAYRPYSAQRTVVQALTALAQADPEVNAGITTPPWSMTYFINTGISNHQKGFAVDVGLARVSATRLKTTGGYSYLVPTAWEAYEMPTSIHELSMAAASTTGPGETTLASTMNPPALALRDYFAQAGMTPLESEWWHFNDYAARTLAEGRTSTGGFEVTRCASRSPG